MKQPHLFEDQKQPRCRVCGRKLKSPKTIKAGIGKTCEKKGSKQ